MIHKRTTLVLGAGASVPYGFPTNDGLVKMILDGCREQNSDFRIALCAAGAKDQEITDFHRTLERTQFFSIDAFLEHQPRFADIGKLAIAQALIPCEVAAKLTTPMEADQHWYRLLFNHLVGREGFSASHLSVITFNYDRSLQEYLFQTVAHEFQLSPTEAMRRVRAAKFVHVHGNLGLPEWWGSEPVDALYRPYAPSCAADTLGKAAKGILTISDVRLRRNEEFRYLLQSILREAEVIGFLGFGYHDILMERLDIAKIAVEHRNIAIYGSAFKLPKGRRLELQQSIERMEIGRDDESCFQFLQSSSLLYQSR